MDKIKQFIQFVQLSFQFILGKDFRKLTKRENGVDQAQLFVVTSAKDKPKYGGYTAMYSLSNTDGWTCEVNVGLDEAPVLAEMKELAASMKDLQIAAKADKKDMPASPDYNIQLIAWGGKYDPILWTVMIVKLATGYQVNYLDERNEVDPQVIKKLLETDFSKAVSESKKI